MGIIKNQRGLAPIAIVLVVLVLAVAGAAYYFVSKNGKSSQGGTSVSNKAAEAECQKAIDDKDLCKMVSSYEFGGNYSVVMTVTQDGETSNWTVRNDGDNSHSIMSSEGQSTEFISHNGDSFMKNPDGTWVKYPKTEGADVSDPTSDLTSDFNFGDDFDEAEAGHYTKVGKEPCGNLTCFHYKYTHPKDAEESYDIWFDDKEYKIRKMTSVSADGTAEMLFTYGDAKVSPPSDYTEMPDYSSMSQEELQQMLQQYGQ